VPYLGHTYTKKAFVVYLTVTFNRLCCVLSAIWPSGLREALLILPKRDVEEQSKRDHVSQEEQSPQQREFVSPFSEFLTLPASRLQMPGERDGNTQPTTSSIPVVKSQINDQTPSLVLRRFSPVPWCVRFLCLMRMRGQDSYHIFLCLPHGM
jgi:hypothetical protein